MYRFSFQKPITKIFGYRLIVRGGRIQEKTFLRALTTGLVEVVGTLIGYFAVSISTVILPFALAFAGGTMLYVISDEMIPETHAQYGEYTGDFTTLFIDESYSVTAIPVAV